MFCRTAPARWLYRVHGRCSKSWLRFQPDCFRCHLSFGSATIAAAHTGNAEYAVTRPAYWGEGRKLRGCLAPEPARHHAIAVETKQHRDSEGPHRPRHAQAAPGGDSAAEARDRRIRYQDSLDPRYPGWRAFPALL